MTFKEWLDSKGLDAVTEELRELAESITNMKISVTTDVDGDYCVMFIFNFEDGSYYNQEKYFDDEIEDDFDTAALLRWLADGMWESACDFWDELNSYQLDFVKKLNTWLRENN